MQKALGLELSRLELKAFIVLLSFWINIDYFPTVAVIIMAGFHAR